MKERVEGFIKDRVKNWVPVARSTGPVDRRKPRPSSLQSVDRPVDRLWVKIKKFYIRLKRSAAPVDRAYARPDRSTGPVDRSCPKSTEQASLKFFFWFSLI